MFWQVFGYYSLLLNADCFSQTFGKRIQNGKTFIAALQRHTSLIPRASYGQAVFFALGTNNFTKMWHAYLGAGLHALGYQVLFIIQDIPASHFLDRSFI
jgi:hypothetical protein